MHKESRLSGMIMDCHDTRTCGRRTDFLSQAGMGAASRSRRTRRRRGPEKYIHLKNTDNHMDVE